MSLFKIKKYTDEVTEQELLEKTIEIVKDYLGTEYTVKDGMLYKKAWTMRRLSPSNVEDKFYMEV